MSIQLWCELKTQGCMFAFGAMSIPPSPVSNRNERPSLRVVALSGFSKRKMALFSAPKSASEAF